MKENVRLKKNITNCLTSLKLKILELLKFVREIVTNEKRGSLEHAQCQKPLDVVEMFTKFCMV